MPTMRTIAESLTALPLDELAALYAGVTNAPELFAIARRPRLAAFYFALDLLLAAELIRRDGRGDGVARVADALTSATKDLDIMEQATVGQQLRDLADATGETPTAAAFWRALLWPIRAELDVRAVPA